jgi:Lsr2
VARQVVVQVFCDVCESSDGASALEFSIDRSAFEIDLCAEHRSAFTGALAPFVGHARSARSRTAAAPSSAGTGTRRVVRRDPSQTEAIRRWAKENGFAISGRGRIPGHVEEAYNARGRS